MRLTDDDRTERAQTRGQGGVFVRDTVGRGMKSRAARGGEASEIEAILERNRQTVEQRLGARAEVARQRIGLAKHSVCIEREVYVVAVVAIRAGERLLDGSTRRDVSARERVAKSLHGTGCAGWHQLTLIRSRHVDRVDH